MLPGGMHFSECIPPLYLIDKSNVKTNGFDKVSSGPRLSLTTRGTIYYQIIHERKVRQLLLNYKSIPG